MLEDNCSKHEGPMGDMVGTGLAAKNQAAKGGKGGGKRREQNYVVRDLITCLALCHNVTPTYPDPHDPTLREF